MACCCLALEYAPSLRYSLIFETYSCVMCEQSEQPSKPASAPAVKPTEPAAVASPLVVQQSSTEIGQVPPASELTPEEQMARFAKELQEKDWGHQPC